MAVGKTTALGEIGSGTLAILGCGKRVVTITVSHKNSFDSLQALLAQPFS